MSGSKSIYTETQLLEAIFGGTTFPVPAGLFVSLYNAMVTQASRDANDAGHIATEVQGGGYARVALPPGSTNWSVTGGGPTKAANVSTINFPTPTASWGSIFSFGIYDAASAGNLLYWGDLVGPAQAGYCNAASPAVISAPANGLSVNQPVRVWSPVTLGLPGLPAGLSDETLYYVGSLLTLDQFTLSLTTGNTSPVNTTSSGLVMFATDQSQAVAIGNTVQFTPQGITVIED